MVEMHLCYRFLVVLSWMMKNWIDLFPLITIIPATHNRFLVQQLSPVNVKAVLTPILYEKE